MRVAARLAFLGAWFLMLSMSAACRQAPAVDAPADGHPHGGQAPDHFAHRFDDVEELTRRFDDPSRDEWQMPSRVIDALQIAPGESVADIGAGTGYFTMRLAKSPSRPRVYAVDIEPAMIDHLRHRSALEGADNVTAVQASADRANLPEPVDVVLLVDTYHHIANRVAYFTALKASMKPGARLAIVDFRKGAPEGPPEEFRFTPQQIGEELGAAGYSLVAEYDFLPRQHFLVFRPK